jgi:pimeloyl-ACP methyl ester carboxylesterase
MERPVMNPMYSEQEGPAQERPRLTLVRMIRGVVRLITWILTVDIFFWRRGPELKVEDGSPVVRLMRAMAFRLVFVPFVLVFLVGAYVYIATHPVVHPSYVDPMSFGIYYDPVNYVSSDNIRLEGWFIPTIDARVVLEKKEAALQKRPPVVVLVHGHGESRQRMLELVRPLHDAGYAVLVAGLRGSGGSRMVGSTFGYREAQDVKAAVEMLRRRQDIDASRIALIGTGSGANAALWTASQDLNLGAVVLDRPVTNLGEALAEQMGPMPKWLTWIRPSCKWAFEIAYRVDAEDGTLAREVRELGDRPVLWMNQNDHGSSCFSRRGLEQTALFIDTHLSKSAPKTAAVETK